MFIKFPIPHIDEGASSFRVLYHIHINLTIYLLLILLKDFILIMLSIHSKVCFNIQKRAFVLNKHGQSRFT